MNIDRVRRWGFILLFAGFAIGIPGVWLLLAPNHYEAGVTIHFEPGTVPIEAYEVLKTESLLGRVVTNLHLDVEWGKRYANGRSLSEADACQLLRQCLRFGASPGQDVIQMSIISEDAAEAANTANGIAENFRDHYLAQDQPSTTITAIDRAVTPAEPMRSNGKIGKILIGAGVLLLLAGVRFLWRAYFAAPIGH